MAVVEAVARRSTSGSEAHGLAGLGEREGAGECHKRTQRSVLTGEHQKKRTCVINFYFLH